MLKPLRQLLLFILIMPATRAGALDTPDARDATGPAETALDEILVTGTLRPTASVRLPESVTVLDEQTLRSAGVQHFEDVLGLIPDLNWASGTSRPRFFQLRGVGEVEQYQGAPNPSVGFLIDGIDFSGEGMPATLFDTEQIDVLRGPQGTTHGANALAGLISVRTANPGDRFELRSEVTGATYNTRSAGLVVGNGTDDGASGWRLAGQKYRSDGFRHNAYLNSDSTNGLNEETLRGKLRWTLANGLSADLVLMHVNLNNGYDAWSVDNTRTTYTNQPGRDAQVSDATSLRLEAADRGVRFTSVTSAVRLRSTYSFDGDWGNDAYWLATTGYAPYDYFQSDTRERRTLTEDLRIGSVSPDDSTDPLRWIAGLYLSRLREADSQAFTWQAFDAGPTGGPGTGGSALSSEYVARTVALYGSVDRDFRNGSTVSAGLRVERRTADYSDTADGGAPFPTETNDMLGLNLSCSHALGPRLRAYGTVSRGYKGGGFNVGSGLLEEQREYQPESLWNAEAGLKGDLAHGRLHVESALFYMRRHRMQVYTSQQLQQTNPLDYVFYTQNAGSGENLGLEVDSRWRISPRWQLSVTGSLLRARYLADDLPPTLPALGGRAQPFAPGYKASVSLDYAHPSGAFVRVDGSAIGSFYYYTSDAQSSKAYALTNVRLGYQRGSWAVSGWIRNAFNARYAQNGFFFGLVPPDFPNQAFLQLGDPRQIGLTATVQLGRPPSSRPVGGEGSASR